MGFLIATERLVIRRFCTGDEGFLVELLNEPSFVRNIGVRQAQTVIDGATASYERFGFGLFHVALRGSGEAIGMCGLLKRDWLDDVDIGFALLERHCGLGYGFEAASAVMEFGWTRAGLKRIVAITKLHNEASMRLLQKLGMKFEGTVRWPDATEDSNLFGLGARGGGYPLPH